jgi:hypothetical protein
LSGELLSNRVQAITSAYAKCVATGNAYGCAIAEATASAWAQACASAHASAVAQASNYCECKDATAYAFAMAQGAADFEARIKADVSASASAEVCVVANGGTASAEISVIATCIEKKYAYVMALAQARALIAGKCKYGLTAEAEIQAIASGTLVTKSQC